MPADWEEARQTCIDANPDWKDMLWTEETSRDFIRRSYPWFLNTYDGYRFPVQRVDATKYFLMLHYGGIYLDLDNGCLQSLEPLLYLPTWTTDGGRGALSNNILGSVPATAFWRLLTDSLIRYNYNYLFPYITISYASGQWFETAIWQTYHAGSAHGDNPLADTNRPLHRIMMDDRPDAPPWIFFTQLRGGTWVNWDNDLFLWIGDHLLLLAVAICALVALVWRASVLWLGRGCRLRAQNYVVAWEYQTKEVPNV
ncbi:hypothetical protein LTR96_011289 [Exophiala xenobiotica]|nr:hypothetical protein LTR96_011289 [Exophiala xenobiotica]KAK5311570.1 hypothetical protein LTR93_011671 [Exophiala xenobiotica]KAK5332563.1 hypothetical protein LTR98_011309 [Exophiala xenobiotica]